MADPLAAFASKEDVTARPDLADLADHPRLQEQLEAATSAIRAYCRWHIAGVEQRTHIRVQPFPDEVFIPAMRIVSVDAARIDGRDHLAGSVEFDPGTGWTPLHGCRISVTYTAGFENVPAEIKALCLEMAAAALGSPIGISREAAGGVSVTYSRSGSGVDTAPGSADVALLAPYRLGWLP